MGWRSKYKKDCKGLHLKVDRSLQVVKDLHHSITDFWSNTISRYHSDRLGLGIAWRRYVRDLGPRLHTPTDTLSSDACISCALHIF